MKKSASTTVKNTTPKSNRPVDRVAAEFAEIRARKIPAKDVVWMFRFTASNDEQRQVSVAACVEFLAGELGKRSQIVLDATTVNRRKIQDVILKPPKLTPALLRKLDRGMAECCKRMKVKYIFLGYGEEVYQQGSWGSMYVSSIRFTRNPPPPVPPVKYP